MGLLNGIGKSKKSAGSPDKSAMPKPILPPSSPTNSPAFNAANKGNSPRSKKSLQPPPNHDNQTSRTNLGPTPNRDLHRSKFSKKRRKKGGVSVSPRERIASAAAPLHDRRRRLVGARETTMRDLGGLMLEMYKRNRFREELLLDKCEEVLAIEVEIAHVDQRLFQLAPPNAAGMRPIGRCECGAPIHPGQNFCGVCGRSFATLTQPRSCTRCGGGLRPGDQFCARCGSEAPDALQAIDIASSVPSTPDLQASTLAMNAVAETIVMDAPKLEEEPPSSKPLTTAPSPSVAPSEDPSLPTTAAPSTTSSDTHPTPPLDTHPTPPLDAPTTPPLDTHPTPPLDAPVNTTEVDPESSIDSKASLKVEPISIIDPAPPNSTDHSSSTTAPAAAPDAAIDAAIESIQDRVSIPAPPSLVDLNDTPIIENTPQKPLEAKQQTSTESDITKTQSSSEKTSSKSASSQKKKRFFGRSTKNTLKKQSDHSSAKQADITRQPILPPPAALDESSANKTKDKLPVAKELNKEASNANKEKAAAKEAAAAKKAAAKEAAAAKKAAAQEAKQRAKDAKERAKAKAKAMREQRKHGGDS